MKGFTREDKRFSVRAELLTVPHADWRGLSRMRRR